MIESLRAKSRQRQHQLLKLQAEEQLLKREAVIKKKTNCRLKKRPEASLVTGFRMIFLNIINMNEYDVITDIYIYTQQIYKTVYQSVSGYYKVQITL